MRNALILFLALGLLGCDSKLMDGWSKLDADAYYKVHALGDGEKKAQAGDKIYAAIELYGASGKQIYSNKLSSGALHRFDVSNKDNIWNKVFGVMHEGDSATFSFQGSEINIQSLTQGKIESYSEELTLSVKLIKLIDEKTQLSRTIKTVDADVELQELKRLSEYFEQEQINHSAMQVDGIYFTYLKRGDGKKAVSGDNVWINYKGWFLNGKEFDNTYKRGQMLDFQLGKPDQVIRGFEIALSKMKEGDKVKLYLPSQFAFGEQGSSDGRVPPFTSVVYELELFQIN